MKRSESDDEIVEEAKADFLAAAEDVEHANVMAAFLQWDRNGDGIIDKEELRAVFEGLGLHVGDAELSAMFLAADVSKDDQVDYSEFLQWIFKSAHWQLRNQFLQTGVSWHGVHKGRNTQILPDRVTVKRGRGQGEVAEFPVGHAVVASSGVARHFRFLLVDNNGVYKEGGFEAGFTGSPPEDLPKPLPARARDVAGAYVSDPKGRLVIDGQDTQLVWKHHLIPSGKVVDVSCKNGKFQILLDGKLAADWPISVPDEMDLYPIMSVYGTTRAIKLLPLDGD